MEIINAEHIIQSQWDQIFGHDGLLRGEADESLALRFQIEISIENFGYERDGNTHHPEWCANFFRVVEIVVTSRHQVFARTRGISVILGDWVNTSNHDSCWRSDGLRIIHETMMQGYELCWGHVPEEHKVTPAAMYRHCTINGGMFFSRRFLDIVQVNLAYDGNTERFLLKEMKPKDFVITVVG